MEKINVQVIEPTCEHNLLAVLIGEEVLKVLETVDKKDLMESKVIVTFSGMVKAEIA